MRKTLLLLLCMGVSAIVFAQTDTTLQHYTGKFKFPEGSVVNEVTISLDKGVLMAVSAMGSSELKKIEGDTFSIVSYNGTATFRRNEGKITGVEMIVGDIILEGTKSEEQHRSINMGEKMHL